MTLNTFHSAGIASKNNTVQGIPRLKEILDGTKNCRTPSNRLRLLGANARSEEFASALARTLGSTRLGALVRRTHLVLDPDPRSTCVLEDKIIVHLNSFFVNSERLEGCARWVARLVLRKNELQMRDMTPPMLTAHLRMRLGERAEVISSETNSLNWVLRLRLMDVGHMAANGFQTEKARLDIEQTLVQRTIAMILEQIEVCGHSSISTAREVSIDVWNGETNVTEYAIDTIGTMLATAAMLPYVSWENSTSNDVHEVIALLGIEAGVCVVIQEITAVISFDGTYVDKRHISQIANAMTSSGELRPISRHGMNKADSATGPLVRSSFEETCDILTEAALFSEVDDARGVTSSVMNGERSAIGTGSFDLIMPAWSLPSEGEVSRRPARLAKSKVRATTAAKQPVGTVGTIEFVDESLWSFKGCEEDGKVEAPFCTNEDEQFVEATSRGSACYALPPTTNSKRAFVPSSPNIVVGTQKHH